MPPVTSFHINPLSLPPSTTPKVWPTSIVAWGVKHFREHKQADMHVRKNEFSHTACFRDFSQQSHEMGYCAMPDLCVLQNMPLAADTKRCVFTSKPANVHNHCHKTYVPSS